VVAHEWILFSVGRVLAYLAVGFVENAVPSYASELAPVSVRGFFSGSLLFFVLLGNLWGAGMSKAYATETGRIGWMIPVAMQFIPAVCLIVALPFTPGR